MSEKEKLVTAYHEGGHALVAAALPGSDPVHKVTILPRGRALGYTMVLPDEDKYSQTRSELLDKLAYMMGGRAAEEMVFHDPTTGAGNDIEKATNLARAMVTQYGMTETPRRDQAGRGQLRAVPGPRHRATAATTPRTSPRRSTRRPRSCSRAPTRRRSTSSRRTATSSTRWCSSCSTRRRSTRRRSPRSSSRCGGARRRPAWTGSPDRNPSEIPPDRHPPGDPRPRRRSTGSPARGGEAGVVITPPGAGGDVHGDPGLGGPTPPEPTSMTDPSRCPSGPRRRAGVRPRARRGRRARAAHRDRRGPRPRGPARHPGPGGAGVRRADLRAADDRRGRPDHDVRPRARRDGPGPRHRALVDVRAPPGPVHRRGPRRLHPGRRPARSPGCPSWRGSSTSTPSGPRCRSG